MNKPRKTPGLAVRLTALALFGILCLLVIGLGAELYLRSQPQYGRAGFSFDSQLIYRLTPGLSAQKPHAWGKTGLPPFVLTFNNEGFRGPGFARSKSAGVVRILALGDSYAAGLDYPDSLTFLGQWERMLNAGAPAGVRYEVLNASCPAWGADQQYVYWKSMGQALQPDVVVLLFSPNDIREMWNHGLVRTHPQTGEIAVKTATLPRKERLGWALACRSSLFQYIQQKFLHTNYGDFLKVFHYYPVHYGIEDSTDWDRPLFLKTPFQEVEQSYALFERLLLDMQADCANLNADLHLIKLPIRLEIDSTYQDTSQYFPAIVETRLAEIASRNQVNFHNYNARLRQHPTPNDLFMEWEYHYDQDGHDWVARALQTTIDLNQ